MVLAHRSPCARQQRRRGRAADGVGLEYRRPAWVRGFESLRLLGAQLRAWKVWPTWRRQRVGGAWGASPWEFDSLTFRKVQAPILGLVASSCDCSPTAEVPGLDPGGAGSSPASRTSHPVVIHGAGRGSADAGESGRIVDPLARARFRGFESLIPHGLGPLAQAVSAVIVVQLAEALGRGPRGCGFESRRSHRPPVAPHPRAAIS